MVKQDYAEAFGDVNYANTWTLIFLHVSALSILIVSVLITRHMITIIKRRDAEADRLNDQLSRREASPRSASCRPGWRTRSTTRSPSS